MQRSPEGAAINYYERHLGDYARDTAHLSLLEHGVYTLLLDRYYSTEAPIPVGQAHRIARARSRDERAAVDAVLSEFFTQSPEGWRNARCDAEIARYMESEPEREQKRESAKERQRRARDRRRELFDELRSHGIVPAFDATTAALQAELSRVTGKPRHAPVTRDDTATRHQTPDTNTVTTFKGDGSSEVSAQPADRPTVTPGAQACIAMRSAGIPAERLNPQHAELLAALDAGATPEEFGATAAELIASGKPPHLTYVVRAVMGRRTEAKARASPLQTGRPSVTDSFANRTYTGTPDDELPEHLRPAA